VDTAGEGVEDEPVVASEGNGLEGAGVAEIEAGEEAEGAGDCAGAVGVAPKDGA
jgi:hypothetical protein